MKKSYLVALLVIVVFFVSCQKNPENSIIKSKQEVITQQSVSSESAELTQKSGENIRHSTISEKLKLPTNWKETVTPNDRLTIDIDTDFLISEVADVATYSIAPQEITQKMATDLIGKLFGDAKIYEPQPPEVTTQEDILTEVLQIRNYLDEIEENDPQRYKKEFDEWNVLIKEQMQSLGNFPESYQLIPSDGLFQTTKKFIAEDTPEIMNPDIQKISIQADLDKSNPAQLEITQSKKFKDGNVWFSNANNINGSEVKLKISDVEKPIDLKATLDEAISLADEQLNKLEMSNYSFQEAYYGVFSDGNFVTNSTSIADRNPYYFDLYYTQKADGISLSYTSPFMMVNLDERVSEAWGSEVIQISVDDDGVFLVNWVLPTSIGNMIDSSVALLNFKEVKNIIIDNLTFIYMPPKEYTDIKKLHLYANKIELAYTKRLKQNSDYEYILTPCWNVYGDVQTYYSEEIQDPNYDENNAFTDSKPMGTLLTINAIDGSLINTDLGY